MRKSLTVAALVVVGCAFALVQAQRTKTTGLTALDYAEIQQLYSHYAYAYDSGTIDEYTNMFTPDAEFIITGGQTFKGPTRLAQLVRSGPTGAGSPVKNRLTLNHFTTNVAIDPMPLGAKGRAYLAVIEVRKGGDRFVRSSGLYEDVLVKTDNGWRFKSRVYTRLPDPDGVATPPTQ
jgi:hypothetical protein